MIETEKELWAQLFQDSPIPRAALENFQAKIMAEVAAHPMDFREEIRLEKRRKWGLGLAISLMVIGIAIAAILWHERDFLYSGLNLILVMLSGLPFALELRQVGHQILQGLLLYRELKIGLGLLWGVISWPVFGILSIIIIFSGSNPVDDRKPSI